MDIARCLGVSERTLRRWRYQFGLMTNRNFTNLANQRLDEHVRDILKSTPSVGLSLMRGALRARGLNIQRERVRESMNRVDPVSRTVHHTQFITRRVYNVRSPNSLWWVKLHFTDYMQVPTCMTSMRIKSKDIPRLRAPEVVLYTHYFSCWTPLVVINSETILLFVF